MPDELVTSVELGERLGIADRTVRVLAQKGIIHAQAPNRYPLWASVKAYCGNLREQAAGRAAADNDDGPPDLARERALLARAQREGQNMKNAVLRGELLPIDDVEAVTGAALDAVRAKMLALPTRAAPECLGLSELNEAKEVLTGLVHDCLGDISSTAVVVAGAVDRARRRIGRGAASDTVDAQTSAPAAPDGKPVGG